MGQRPLTGAEPVRAGGTAAKTPRRGGRADGLSPIHSGCAYVRVFIAFVFYLAYIRVLIPSFHILLGR